MSSHNSTAEVTSNNVTKENISNGLATKYGKFNKNLMKFSVDLVKAALAQITFLSEVDRHPTLYNDADLLIYSLQRYEFLWLPLIVEQENPNKKDKLLPSLDVEWIWHVHMLSPLAYQKDCQSMFGKIIDHQLISGGAARHHAIENGRKAWQRRYSLDKPFDIDLSGETQYKCDPNCQSRISYDIRRAISRQCSFYYQISLPHYSDKGFLETALIRYKKFLFLKKINPKKFLVPCYDNDLIWHSHQLFPVAYANDTEKIIGKTLNHDDDVTDRSPGSKLCEADIATSALWKSAFGEDFSRPGCMWRGDPPHGKLYEMRMEEIFDVSSKSTIVTLRSVDLSSTEDPSMLSATSKAKVIASFDYSTPNRENESLIDGTHAPSYTSKSGDRYNTRNVIWKSPTTTDHTLYWNNTGPGGLVRRTFKTRNTSNLFLELVERRGSCCWATKQLLAAGSFPLIVEVERHAPKLNMEQKLQLVNDLSSPFCSVRFSLTMEPPTR